jgi:hypothetical protein
MPISAPAPSLSVFERVIRVVGPGQMLDVEPDEFRSAERAGKAHQEKRLVADAGHVVAADLDELLDVGGGEGGRSARWLAMRPTDASQGLPDGWVPGVERLLGDAMSARDGGDATTKRRQGIAAAGVGQVGADDLGRRRHWVEMALDTPSLEVGQVGFVGAERRRRICGRLVGL